VNRLDIESIERPLPLRGPSGQKVGIEGHRSSECYAHPFAIEMREIESNEKQKKVKAQTLANLSKTSVKTSPMISSESLESSTRHLTVSSTAGSVST
jgi:hypothetical protein